MTEAGLAPVLRRFARIGARALLVVLAAGVILEIALRLMGHYPQVLFRTGVIGATMPDSYTGWGTRPDVRVDKYTVTNAWGLHEDREVTLRKPVGLKRVAVLGSSVVWGLGQEIGDTIPRAAQAEMTQAGCKAQVLNFAGIGFNILNAAAFLQTKVHQFEPDAVVVVMDLQMGVPRFPRVQPGVDPSANVETLGTLEGWFKRATEYSVVLTALDDVKWSRGRLKETLPLPAEVPRPAKKEAAPPDGARHVRKYLDRLGSGMAAIFEPFKDRRVYGGPGQVSPAEGFLAVPAPDGSVAAYEERRARQLGGLVASMSAFARRMGMRIYFVTPYGPFFHATPDQLKLFSLPMLQDAAAIYGSLDAALRREAELMSQVVAREAALEGAGVIDMLPASREATMALGEFSADGIHFTPAGYHRVGRLVAQRLVADGICR